METPATTNSYDGLPLPNPFTPMAFLPPEIAFQAMFTIFVCVCSLGILIWDILHHLKDDYRLAFKTRFNVVSAIYFLSRLSTLGYVLGKSIQLNNQIIPCREVESAMCAIFIVAHGATAFLLYVRVCAVYSMQPSVMVFFGFTWIAVVAGASTTLWALKGIHIGPTNYCATMVIHEFVLATTWSDFVNDTLVFLAIIYKLSVANIPRSSNAPAGIWVTLRGRSPMIQGFTKAFMQDSQIYYLIAVAMNLATTIMFMVIRSPNAPFRIMMIVPNTVVVNIMACRVFRNIKFGRHDTPSARIPLPHNLSRSYGETSFYNMSDMPTRSGAPHERINTRSHAGLAMDEGKGRDLGKIEVTKVVELSHDYTGPTVR